MANLNLSEFGEKLFVTDADHTFIWDTVGAISKRVSRNSWLSGTTADFHLGLADAASPVAQTISVQSVAAGTSNTAGANLSINGSQGTGTGAGGSLLLRTAPAGSSGTAQNALVTAVAITAAGNVGIGTTSPTSNLTVAQGTAGDGTISVGAAGTTVTGVDTKFLNTFAVGQTITSAGQTLTISAIASDTSMTISPAAGAAISGQAYTLVGGTRFTVAGNGKVGIGANVFLERDADNQLALRNGAAEQTFNVYNTYQNDGGGYERIAFKWSTNIFRIGREYGGTGSARNIRVIGGGSVIGFGEAPSAAVSWTFSVNNFLAGTDNTYDIGAAGANRPRNVYVGSNIYASGNVGIGTTSPTSKLQVTGGDVEIETVTSGIIMKAAGTSTRYRITLNAGGTALVFTAI